MQQKVVIDINPKSDELCGDCKLLRGIHVASCIAGFQPVFSGQETIRPQECRDAAQAVELTKMYLSTWSTLP